MGDSHDHQHDHECGDGCDHDHEGEISISFAPRFEDLTKHGITPEQFEEALLVGLEEFETLSAREDVNVDDLNLEEIVLRINGKEFQLSDLADVEISEELEGEEYEDDDEDEEFEEESDG